MRNKILLTTILFPLIIFSQGIIKGKIINQDNKPIESIEVLLLSKDSIALKNDITNADGKFEIKISNGSYIFQVRQLGAMLKEETINLNDFLDLGVLQVIENQQILKEVIINSKKKLIERKVDRLIFNLENSISASGGDAIDA